MNNNPNQRVIDVDATQVSEIVDGVSSPSLLYYDLNLNDNLLILKFSEAVRLDTFNVSAITLQSTPTFINGVTDIITLNQRSRIGQRGFNSLLFIELTVDDEEEIKNPRSSLAKSVDSTYLSLEQEAAENYFGFRVLNISGTNALAVRQYFEGLLIKLLL